MSRRTYEHSTLLRMRVAGPHPTPVLTTAHQQESPTAGLSKGGGAPALGPDKVREGAIDPARERAMAKQLNILKASIILMKASNLYTLCRYGAIASWRRKVHDALSFLYILVFQKTRLTRLLVQRRFSCWGTHDAEANSWPPPLTTESC